MNIVIFGPPGVGKGSISLMLKRKYDVPHISTGNILREESKKNPSIKVYLEKGALVPDEKVMSTVKKRLGKKDCEKGFILDGFPRTLTQARFLKEIKVAIDFVLNLVLDTAIIISRLGGRLICPKDDSIYHTKNIPPKKPGICDKCGAKLVQRKDDKPEVIKKRIKVYKKQTEELIRYYRNEKLLIDIPANITLDKIFDNIVAAIKDKV